MNKGQKDIEEKQVSAQKHPIFSYMIIKMFVINVYEKWGTLDLNLEPVGTKSSDRLNGRTRRRSPGFAPIGSRPTGCEPRITKKKFVKILSLRLEYMVLIQRKK